EHGSILYRQLQPRIRFEQVADSPAAGPHRIGADPQQQPAEQQDGQLTHRSPPSAFPGCRDRRWSPYALLRTRTPPASATAPTAVRAHRRAVRGPAAAAVRPVPTPLPLRPPPDAVGRA